MAEYIISDKQYAKLIFAAGNHDYNIMDDVAEELENNEIVRCKDCYYCDESDSFKPAAMFCQNGGQFFDDTDCFCAWGERRAD